MLRSASLEVTEPIELGRRRRPRRWAGALAVVVAAVLGGTLVSTPAEASSGAGQFVSDANSARSSHGAKALATRSDLTSIAQRQAQRMASSGVLAHNPKLTSDVRHWLKVGENVGYGPDVESIQNAFMNSSGHRANILDPDFTDVGVGVVVKNGVVWVAEVFRQPDGTGASRAAPKKHAAAPKKHSTPAKAAKVVVEVDRETPQTSPSPTAAKSVTAKPSVKATRVSPPRPARVPDGVAPPSARPTPTQATAASSPATELVAQGGSAPQALGPTQNTDARGDGSPWPAAGTLGLIALLGLAVSLRTRRTS